jgi:hypothetical protein
MTGKKLCRVRRATRNGVHGMWVWFYGSLAASVRKQAKAEGVTPQEWLLAAMKRGAAC